MANRNPYQARVAKRRRRKPGDMFRTRQVLWLGILAAERALDDADPDRVLRACHALSQCCTGYAKLAEVGELEARVQQLEVLMEKVCPAKT